MDNGMNTGLNASDIILGSALSGRGYGGAWGGGYGYPPGYAPFAGPASNAVRIDRNADLTRLSLDRVSDQAEETRRILQDQNQVSNVNTGFNRICDKLSDAEFRTGDRLRDLEREINANARAAAECCCETQKEILRLDASNNLKFAELGKDICQVESRLTAEIRAVEGRAIERQLNAANAELTALKTQIACGCTTGCSRPCPPCNG